MATNPMKLCLSPVKNKSKFNGCIIHNESYGGGNKLRGFTENAHKKVLEAR